jgi:transcription elongation factor Elf1
MATEPNAAYPATFKCFDCGHEREAQANSRTMFAGCPECDKKGDPGMMLVYTLNGEPVNRGYFPADSEV